MIKKNSELNNISSFKKFSEMTGSKKPKEGQSETELPFDDGDIPMNPNVPKEVGKVEKTMDTKYMMPNADSKNEEVEFYGKVAKLPKGVKAHNGYNFLENIKVPKSSIWYIMVEKQDNELQMVKYDHKKGINLVKFVSDLKSYYKTKYSGNQKIVKLVESIEIGGNDKFSSIRNIPLIELDGQKMISRITEDLIKLLSK